MLVNIAWHLVPLCAIDRGKLVGALTTKKKVHKIPPFGHKVGEFYVSPLSKLASAIEN